MTDSEPPMSLEPVLARVPADVATYYGLRQPRLVRLHYQDRPGSHVLCFAVHDDDAGPLPNVFVKVSKPRVIAGGDQALRDRVCRDFETTRRAHALMRDQQDIGVVPPIVCYPEHLAIVTEEVHGPTLLEYLGAHAGWGVAPDRMAALEATMRRTGRWIRTFQTTAEGDVVDRRSFHDYIDYRLQRLVRSDRTAMPERERGRILEHIDALIRKIEPTDFREVAIHSDLALSNVLVSDQRIVVLDFAMAKLGTRLHDLTRMWVQLDLMTMKPHFRNATVRRLQTALLAGFDERLSPDRPLFRLLGLLHRINQLAKLSSGSSVLRWAPYDWLARRHYRRRVAEELRTPLDQK